MNKSQTPTIGEILKVDFMEPLGLSDDELSKAVNIPILTLKDIINNEQGISIQLSNLLGDYFGVSREFFYKLQKDIDARNTFFRNK